MARNSQNTLTDSPKIQESLVAMLTVLIPCNDTPYYCETLVVSCKIKWRHPKDHKLNTQYHANLETC